MSEQTYSAQVGRRQAVTGRVVDPAGRPVAGAQVRVLVQGRGGVTHLAEGRSGPDGEYRLDVEIPRHVATGRHGVFVEALEAGDVVQRLPVAGAGGIGRAAELCVSGIVPIQLAQNLHRRRSTGPADLVRGRDHGILQMANAWPTSASDAACHCAQPGSDDVNVSEHGAVARNAASEGRLIIRPGWRVFTLRSVGGHPGLDMPRQGRHGRLPVATKDEVLRG